MLPDTCRTEYLAIAAQDRKSSTFQSQFQFGTDWLPAVLVVLVSVALLVTPPMATAANGEEPEPRTPVPTLVLNEPHTDEWLPDAPARPEFPADPMIGEATIPEFSASAAIAVDVTSGALLFQYQPDTPVAPASTLKIVTALTALTVLEPDEVIEIGGGDLVDTSVYSNAQLQAGDMITVRDLLAGLLIPSGGDAANALARVAGSRLGPAGGQSPRDRFVQEMNEFARQLGITGSNFVNPDGPDHPDQYTTARDMAILGAQLLQDRLLAELVAQPAYEVTIVGPNSRRYEIANTNALLGVDRVHGIKTGTTGAAGEALILATRRNGNQIITVVMGSEERYSDTDSMLRFIDERVRWVEFGASSDFPGIQQAAQRYNFLLAVPIVRPMLHADSNRLYAELSLGPRPRGTLPVRWGEVVFLNDGSELYRIPVLNAGGDR